MARVMASLGWTFQFVSSEAMDASIRRAVDDSGAKVVTGLP